MDKNLWATSNDVNSQDSYGYYYQWWNNYGFPRNWDINISSTQVDASGYWPNNPYLSNIFIIGSKWDSSENRNLWWWNSTSILDKQWPCPVWYHVPSMDEWQWIYETFCNINGFAIVGLNNIAWRIEQFSKTLKLPFAGIDNHRVSPHSIDLRGSWMFYWSSDTYDGHNDIWLNVESPNGERDGLQTWNRWKMTDWLPVRCFKD